MTDSGIQRLLITGLRNAHAMEKQALSIMKPQLRRIEHYPELAALLDKHIAETEGQITRLQELLSQFGEDPSTVKDVASSVAGAISAAGNRWTDDEILQNMMANFAFEHFEIAAYRTLIVIAEEGGFDAEVTALKANLTEEIAVAKWFDGYIEALAFRFVGLLKAGENAGV